MRRHLTAAGGDVGGGAHSLVKHLFRRDAQRQAQCTVPIVRVEPVAAGVQRQSRGCLNCFMAGAADLEENPVLPLQQDLAIVQTARGLHNTKSANQSFPVKAVVTVRGLHSGRYASGCSHAIRSRYSLVHEAGNDPPRFTGCRLTQLCQVPIGYNGIYATSSGGCFGREERRQDLPGGVCWQRYLHHHEAETEEAEAAAKPREEPWPRHAKVSFGPIPHRRRSPRFSEENEGIQPTGVVRFSYQAGRVRGRV